MIAISGTHTEHPKTGCNPGTSSIGTTITALSKQEADLPPGTISLCNALSGTEHVLTSIPDNLSPKEIYEFLQRVVVESTKKEIRTSQVKIIISQNHDGGKSVSYIINGLTAFDCENISGQLVLSEFTDFYYTGPYRHDIAICMDAIIASIDRGPFRFEVYIDQMYDSRYPIHGDAEISAVQTMSELATLTRSYEDMTPFSVSLSDKFKMAHQPKGRLANCSLGADLVKFSRLWNFATINPEASPDEVAEVVLEVLGTELTYPSTDGN